MIASPKKLQEGSAILVALFIVALAVILATAMIVRFRNELLFYQAIFTSNHLYFKAEGATLWAKGVLINDAANPLTIIDPLPLNFTQTLPDGTTISANLTDAQGKFNLNNLTDPEYLPIFTRLLKLAEPTLETSKANAIGLAILKHIVEKQFPNQQQKAFFWQISEIKNEGLLADDILQKIMPDINVLPEITPLNINSADEKNIQSLADGISPNQVKQILKDRNDNKNFNSLGDFIQQEQLQNAKIPTALLTLTSSYFYLTIQISREKDSLEIVDLLRRYIQNNKPMVFIVSETIKKK